MPSTCTSPRRILIVAAALLAGAFTGPPSTFAQQAKPRAANGGRRQAARAGGEQKAPALPRITPEEQAKVDELLRRWEAHTGDIKTLRGQFGRITYNEVFGTKTEDTGSFVYKAPDKGKFWVDTEGDPEKWICNGEEILQFNDETKQVKKITLPEELRGEHIRKGPMPFLFGMSAGELRRRYWLKISKETKTHYWLEAYPLQREDAANFRVAQLILDKNTFLPFAIKLHDPNGKNSRVYTLHNLKRNVIVLDAEFHPPLFGWKVVTVPAGDGGSARPAPRITPRKSKSADSRRNAPAVRN